ncbi:hypothetical protein Pse7367_0729 [Thalassoporum mexicanum PCC 7367]|uniref:YybH family protein n=1 Tax=Thalassoporum mexicanum TaxID=3457544 RepID=UPI00029F9D30|nr:nuclear transport factor 2 family protein [Pseudanabaena sp. PCC 7367]AFY69030.1 hypothetical protein Pse7367_0729 [Pseudanabaena sp. PCC 7367]
MSDKQDVLDANYAFYRAFEKRDFEAMTAVWSQGSDSLCIHPGRSPLKGWPQISKSWQTIFRATKYMEIDTEITLVEVSGDLAYVVLIENVTQISGSNRMQASSTATNLFERMGGKWYLIHHHGSPLLN